MQTCPFCKKKFEPSRLNQLYCSDKCRYTYNNRKARAKRIQKQTEQSDTVERINQILIHNRSILKKYAGQQVEVGQLKQEGFNFYFITYHQTMKAKKQQTGTAYFCYEYGYQFIKETTVEVARRQLEWQTGVGTLKIIERS